MSSSSSTTPYTPSHPSLLTAWTTLKTRLPSLTPDLTQHAKLTLEVHNHPDNGPKTAKDEKDLAEFQGQQKKKVEDVLGAIGEMAEKQLDALKLVSC